MAFALRERSRQDEYANYEQQSPNREINLRQADLQQNYMQGGYNNNYQYTQGYVQSQGQSYYMPQEQPQYVGRYSNRANQYVSNGFNEPEYSYSYVSDNHQYQMDIQFNQSYNNGVRLNQINQISKKPKANFGKKSVNKDLIKIVVTVMVLAIAICGLLIANQFISINNQAQAEEDVQNIDSEVLSSVVSEDGSYASANVTLVEEYKYEKSSNWFDKFCDRLGMKLK